MRHYMQTLRERGEILDVHREVDPKHELAAVTQAAMRRWNKPILFHRVGGTTLPVLTNLYGSRERLADIIGIAPDDFCRQWTNLTGLGGTVAGPLKREVPAAPDLVDCRMSDLPLLTYSERDGAPYFTSAMFVAKEPETGVPNLSRSTARCTSATRNCAAASRRAIT
jgi:UbiD family decarboxylase